MLGVVVFSFKTFSEPKEEVLIVPPSPPPSELPQEEPITPPATDTKLKARTFMGTLETVDTGCFADGECFIEVDGQHVTVLRGWSEATVGSVLGVEGFGDLTQRIGEQVEVYAQVLEDETYTLYGSEGFYVKALFIREGEVQKPTTPTTCVVGGCSAQLCVDKAEAGDMVTTCEYMEAYACYQSATCERQATGECGWTETPELMQCLMKAESNTEAYQLQ